jgi:hypothetical protein
MMKKYMYTLCITLLCSQLSAGMMKEDVSSAKSVEQSKDDATSADAPRAQKSVDEDDSTVDESDDVSTNKSALSDADVVSQDDEDDSTVDDSDDEDADDDEDEAISENAVSQDASAQQSEGAAQEPQYEGEMVSEEVVVEDDDSGVQDEFVMTYEQPSFYVYSPLPIEFGEVETVEYEGEVPDEDGDVAVWEQFFG